MMKKDLIKICEKVKKEIDRHEYNRAISLITESMKNYPDSPVPHNLMGILMETEGEHVKGMKHFRASYALDPTFIPTRVNMNVFTSFTRMRACAYTENDCPEYIKKESYDKYKIIVDENGIGHLEGAVK